ncbi:unnamed protein product, partial [marine sediment metagenome]
AFRTVICRFADHDIDSNKTRPRFALGPEDNVFFSLGQGGYVVLDMGLNTLIVNSIGDDFTVYEGDDGIAEAYEVFVSNNWDGSWNSCGSATGTASFDLSTAGLSQARYIKVVDDGNFSSGQYAGFDLDAIRFFSTTGIEEGQIAHYQSHIPNLSVLPNPFREITNLKFQFGRGQGAEGIELKIYDATGRMVKDFNLKSEISNMQSAVSWNGVDNTGQKLPNGVYFVHFRTGDYKKTEKAILLR